MHCLTCGYDLRALEEARCPECGRTFSQEDPQSFGHAKTHRLLRWAKIVGWVAAITSAGIGTASAIGMFTGQQDLIFAIMLWTFAGMPVVLAMCAYITLRTAAGRSLSFRAIVIGLVLLVFNVSMVTYWPTHLAFRINHNALNAHAQATIQQPHLQTQPTAVGTFRVLETSTRTINNRTMVILKLRGGAGPVHLVYGMSDSEIERHFNIWSYHRLNEDWHIVHED